MKRLSGWEDTGFVVSAELLLFIEMGCVSTRSPHNKFCICYLLK
jgi:hypothetical protein